MHTATLPSGRGELSGRKVSKLRHNLVVSTIIQSLLHTCSVREGVVLRELLERYIHPTVSDPIARHRLSQYVKARDSIHVLMKDNDQLGAHR